MSNHKPRIHEVSSPGGAAGHYNCYGWGVSALGETKRQAYENWRRAVMEAAGALPDDWQPLTRKEVVSFCAGMGVAAILGSGAFYAAIAWWLS